MFPQALLPSETPPPPLLLPAPGSNLVPFFLRFGRIHFGPANTFFLLCHFFFRASLLREGPLLSFNKA